MYGCQQNLLRPDSELLATLEFVCSEANNLINCGIYYARQLYFKTKQLIGKYDLEVEYKTNKHFQAAQQTLRSVAESFKSFKELSQLFSQGELAKKPRLPKYRKSGGMAVVSHPKQALKLVEDRIRVPLGTLVKTWFKVDHFWLQMPSNLESPVF